MSKVVKTIVILQAIAISLAASQCTITASIGFDACKASSLAQSQAKSNWEWGTEAEALLELQDGNISVFADNAFPSGKIPVAQTASTDYAKTKITLDGNTLTAAGVSAGDPASLGVSAILLGQSDVKYLQAAGRQVNELLTKVPRYKNGAISHRYDSVMLWSDNMYMVPPTLAYYGVATNNITTVSEAVRQITLYREALQDKTGLWTHIVGSRTDSGTWSTGNGWAVGGIARVLATITHWKSANDWTTEQALLTQYAGEIIDGAIKAGVDANTGLLRNYITDSTSFAEGAGTAMITAAIYRLIVLAPTRFATQQYLDWANARRQAVAKIVSATGQIQPVVDPYKYTQNTPYSGISPEAQSFVVLLYAAYRDCVTSKLCSSS